MSPVAHQSRYYADEFTPTVTMRRRSLAFAIVAAVIILALLVFGALVIGDYLGSRRTIAQAEAIVKANARSAVPALNPPASLIKCDKAGREEFERTCRARWRSGRVGQ